ncbi:MAG TPA: MFS transporter [Candidatus Marinimicrobia bacterium]|jgi:POT family proton-dependent oligopeptide transporter|nr:POT family MFS transporter [Woeseiaceae bacterium]HIB14963.1 MFS transporter [Candidatus Neomarinimicrobiota bacterium]HIG51186.1 MFS transporter [Candidatus Neomarinimicrobiota bacterium]
MNKYLTAPRASKDIPKGIPYIIGNEAAERFSFYGMKGILVVFMTKYLHILTDNPNLAAMNKAAAIEQYHNFTSWVYLTPILGALLADTLLGKYRTIISLSLVYCLGHLTLAFMGSGGLTPEAWMMTGLALISLGSGGIKPCVSAHVGDQFGESNATWLTKVFGWFYISINVGAFISTILTPWLLEWYGPHLAFGIPGILMAIATYVFWLGRKKFIHIQPKGMGFIRETFSREGLRTMTKLAIIFSFVAVFWALFDQTGSSWVLQAEDLNRNWLGVHWLPSQIQAINPIMIVIMVPIFAFGIYPVLDKVFPLTPLRKVSIGLFVMVIGFAMVSVVQQWVDQGQQPSIGWQIFAYAILTSSEVMVSITCLEFAYTQAPRSMKSVIMALFLMSVSLGNFFTAGVNSFIQVPNQLVAATSLNMTIQAKDKNGKKLLSTQEDILKLTSQTKDINGNSIQYITNQEGSYTLILAGKDGTFGTTTDIRLKFSKGGKQIAVKTAEKTNLNTAFVKIKSYFDSNKNTLPKTQAGTDLIKSIIDNWGSPLQYRLVNRNMFRITSLGADKNYMTENDIVLVSTISRPSKDESAKKKPYSWRENRIIELKGDEGKREVVKSRGGIKEIEFDTAIMVGGQTNLEGSDYFWFFTWLMLGTALVFVFVAFLYKPKTYLHEETK